MYTFLRLAYAANILILIPVAVPTALRWMDIPFFVESEGYRTLCGSLWTGIMISSFLGLFNPPAFAAVLMLQVIYKTMWLMLYAAPRVLAGKGTKEIPMGMTISFLAIVLLYPFVIPWADLLGWPKTA